MSHYIHGTSAEEQSRLSCLNSLINDRCLNALNLTPGLRVLDVGSGLAQLTRLIAEKVSPNGFVLGIERDIKQLETANRSDCPPSLKLRQGDATDLPLQDSEWGTFDLCHTRFLLEHVSEPHRVVKQMAKAVRVGGRVVLSDDDHDILRLWPEPPEVVKLWRSYIQVYEKIGNDPYIGRKLVSLLHQAELQPVRNDWLFFGSCSGDPFFRAYVDNMLGILMGARETIVSHGLLDEFSFVAGIEALNVWKERSDAALWFSICWAEGLRR